MTKEAIIIIAANGNAAAQAFLEVFVRRAHYLDDLEDEPKVLRIADFESEWLFTLAGNPFFVAHREQLVPLMILALNAWADSNKMAAGPVRDVVKGLWHEVVYMTAFIVGGWPHLRAVTAAAREYDLEVLQGVSVTGREEANGTLRQ